MDTSYKSVSVGDEIEIIDNTDPNFGGRFFVVCVDPHLFWYSKDRNSMITEGNWHIGYFRAYFFNIIISNRQQLNDFIKQNQINKSKVSLMLGKSRNWLDTLASNSELKRRGDISDSKLDEAMSLLNIDWNSNNVMHVNTKGFVPYITRPCTYHTDMHKARLQRAYWDGEVIL